MKRAMIIVAGGSGQRMGADIPKQFLPLGDTPILVRTVERMRQFDPEMTCVLVLPSSEFGRWRNLEAEFHLEGACLLAEGGAERTESVRNGLAALDRFEGIIGVHDGVRPLFSNELLRRCFDTAEVHGSAIPVVGVVDSLRMIDGPNSRPVNRDAYKSVQTPQCFRASLLREAYANSDGPTFTDDASAVEAVGHSVVLTDGERSNLKITTSEDLIVAHVLMENFTNQR